MSRWLIVSENRKLSFAILTQDDIAPNIVAHFSHVAGHVFEKNPRRIEDNYRWRCRGGSMGNGFVPLSAKS